MSLLQHAAGLCAAQIHATPLFVAASICVSADSAPTPESPRPRTRVKHDRIVHGSSDRIAYVYQLGIRGICRERLFFLRSRDFSDASRGSGTKSHEIMATVNQIVGLCAACERVYRFHEVFVRDRSRFYIRLQPDKNETPTPAAAALKVTQNVKQVSASVHQTESMTGDASPSLSHLQHLARVFLQNNLAYFEVMLRQQLLYSRSRICSFSFRSRTFSQRMQLADPFDDRVFHYTSCKGCGRAAVTGTRPGPQDLPGATRQEQIFSRVWSHVNDVPCPFSFKPNNWLRGDSWITT